jgi:hypothetical protein
MKVQIKNDLSRQYKDWTDDEAFDLIKYSKQELEIVKIAALLKRSVSAVINKQNEIAGNLMRDKYITLEIIDKRENGKKFILPVQITSDFIFKNAESEEVINLIDDEQSFESIEHLRNGKKTTKVQLQKSESFC